MKTRFFPAIIGVLILCGIASIIIEIIPLISIERFRVEKPLEVSFLDVGQGDSIFVRSPSGSTLLVDAGSDVGAASRLGRRLPPWKREINYVIATHGDSDHIGGFPEIFMRFKIDTVIDNGFQAKTPVESLYRRFMMLENAKYHRAERPEIIDLGSGVLVYILWPRDQRVPENDNDGSVSVKIVYKNTSMILTGDAGQEVEKELISAYGNFLDSDVIKLGHHGSKTSSNVDFLKVVSPSLAIISAGAHNRYGHPSPEVTELLSQLRIPSLCTCDVSTITIHSDGQRIVVK